jgi:hypothetical protein
VKLPCPCGTHRPVMLWRRGASHRYALRCPACHRESNVATTDFEKLDDLWNATVKRATAEGDR